MIKIFLDDIRMPPDGTWLVARNLSEFAGIVSHIRIIHDIMFDYDLGICNGIKEEGIYAVRLIIDRNIRVLHYSCHSMNPVGKARIVSLMDLWIKHKERYY